MPISPQILLSFRVVVKAGSGVPAGAIPQCPCSCDKRSQRILVAALSERTRSCHGTRAFKVPRFGLLYRFLSLFKFIDAHMPQGDHRPTGTDDIIQLARDELFFSPAVAVCRKQESHACVKRSTNRSCVRDTDCDSGEYCAFSQCRRIPKMTRQRNCRRDHQCVTGEICLNSQCVVRPTGCSSDAQCEAGEACEPRFCADDVHCEAGERCVYATCRSTEGSLRRCASDAQCTVPGGANEVCYGDRTYLILLPPGYNEPENANRRYPVVYINHGYGQTPSDLAATVLILGGFMASGNLQKMIIVYPDGRCYLGECERANWYVNHPGIDNVSRFRYEDSVLELIRVIDQRFRTKPEATLTERR